MDRTVIVCNYVTRTAVAAAGAKAYVVRLNPGGGHDRIVVLVCSKGGRYVEKWEDIRYLNNFRVRRVPPEHPRHADERVWVYGDPVETVAKLYAARQYWLTG